MDLQFYLQISVTAIVAVTSWIVAHRFTSSRDLQNSRRQLRTEKLIEIYIKLDRSVGRKILPETLCDLEDAISLLQLFGNTPQIEETIKVAINIGGSIKDNGVSIDDLIGHLKNTLREEIGLEKYNGPIARMRLTYRGYDPRELVSGREQLPPSFDKVDNIKK